MNWNDPRCILIAGLALALNLNGLTSAYGAGSSKTKSLRVAQAQSDIVPPRNPAPPTPGLPALSPTPPPAAAAVTPAPSPSTTPIPAPNLTPSPDASSLDLQPQPSGLPPVTTTPVPLGSQPNAAPGSRLPLGLYYGEQDQLNLNSTPVPRQLPMNSQPTLLSPAPMQGDDIPFDPVPTPSHVGTDRFGFAPPPGTLGQTYKRRSRLIEDNKHPRVGAVEVHLPEEVDVSAQGLKTKWTGKVWRLESDPLLPGVPHIYEIKASWGEGSQPQIRTVRLIMGRIVDLEF